MLSGMPSVDPVAATAWATLGLVVVGLLSTLFVAWQIYVARKTQWAKSRPYVSVHLEPDLNPGVILLVIRNYGKTPALDVAVEITPELTSTPDCEPVRIPKRIPLLLPGGVWKTAADGIVERLEYNDQHPEEPLPLTHRVKIAYKDYEGHQVVGGASRWWQHLRRRHEVPPADLDWEVLKIRYAQYGTIHDVADVMRKVAEQLGFRISTKPNQSNRPSP